MRSSFNQWPLGWESVVRFGQYSSFGYATREELADLFRNGKAAPGIQQLAQRILNKIIDDRLKSLLPELRNSLIAFHTVSSS
jgi:hypothetical protein